VKRAEVEAGHPMISVVRQCELLDMSRSSFYYCPGGEDEYNLTLMRLIDEEFTRHPFYGARRMKAWLRAQGHWVNRKRVSRLMRLMGLVARLSEAAAVGQRAGPQGLPLSVERGDGPGAG